MRRLSDHVASAAALLMLAGSAHAQSAAVRAAAVDSIVLERSRCYGPCPTYRLSVTRAGRVHFTSRNPGDTAATGGPRTEDGRVAPGTAVALTREAAALGFDSLPDRIEGDCALCPDRATDHATVTTTLFGPVGAKRVVDYHGCLARSDHSAVAIVAQLRRFEDAIDRATGSARWARAAGRQLPAEPPPNEASQLSGMHGRSRPSTGCASSPSPAESCPNSRIRRSGR